MKTWVKYALLLWAISAIYFTKGGIIPVFMWLGIGFLAGVMYQGSHLKERMCETCQKKIFEEE